jgi:hypothetical protein
VRRPHGIPGESIYDEGVKFWPFPQASQGAKRQAKVSLKYFAPGWKMRENPEYEIFDKNCPTSPRFL